MKNRRKMLSGALNEYRPLELITEGGMAEVYRAEAVATSGLKRTVALKKILPEYAADDMFVAMFLDEARIAGRLDHPNIVKTLDFGRWDEDTYFIAMEYVKGCDLRTVLTRCNETRIEVPLRHACRIAEEVADALSYVHNRCEDGAPMKIVHRDVSPDNVMVSQDGFVKLTDFGVAKAADRSAWTYVGSVKGKAPYLAPERIDGKGDHRSDIFAAGVLLWELLTKERLFQGESDWEVIQRIEKGDFPAPSTRNRAVPAALDAIVAKALRVNPDHRYQDAAQLRDALRRFASVSGERSSERALSAWIRRVMHDRFQTRTPTTMSPPPTRKPAARQASPRSTPPSPPSRRSKARKRPERRRRPLPEASLLRAETRKAPRVNVHVIRRFAEGTPAFPIAALDFDIDVDAEGFDPETETTTVHPSRRLPGGGAALAVLRLKQVRRGESK